MFTATVKRSKTKLTAWLHTPAERILRHVSVTIVSIAYLTARVATVGTWIFCVLWTAHRRDRHRFQESITTTCGPDWFLRHLSLLFQVQLGYERRNSENCEIAGKPAKIRKSAPQKYLWPVTLVSGSDCGLLVLLISLTLIHKRWYEYISLLRPVLLCVKILINAVNRVYWRLGIGALRHSWHFSNRINATCCRE
jgi:hypothetical protein